MPDGGIPQYYLETGFEEARILRPQKSRIIQANTARVEESINNMTGSVVIFENSKNCIDHLSEAILDAISSATILATNEEGFLQTIFSKDARENAVIAGLGDIRRGLKNSLILINPGGGFSTKITSEHFSELERVGAKVDNILAAPSELLKGSQEATRQMLNLQIADFIN